MKRHLKDEHNLEINQSNSNTLGFNADVLSQLGRFKVLDR